MTDADAETMLADCGERWTGLTWTYDAEEKRATGHTYNGQVLASVAVYRTEKPVEFEAAVPVRGEVVRGRANSPGGALSFVMSMALERSMGALSHRASPRTMDWNDALDAAAKEAAEHRDAHAIVGAGLRHGASAAAAEVCESVAAALGYLGARVLAMKRPEDGSNGR